MASTGLAVAPARAASGDYGTVIGAEQRTCNDTRCSSPRYIPSGTRVPIWCFRDGGQAYGTNRWFRVRYAGFDGWVNANRVSPQPSVPYCSDLKNDETLFPGQEVWSLSGRYVLRMQTDGNLVSYGPSGALWSTRTSTQGSRVVMQSDGNLVIYAGSTPVWFTGTSFSGTWLSVQDDGNVVIYVAGDPKWATSWHRTWGQSRSYNGGVGGNCTWYANERFRAFSGVYPAVSGDAYRWNETAAAMGWLVLSNPNTQSIVVFEINVQGSGSVGHVAWVDGMQGRSDGTYIHIMEMNYKGLGVISDRWVKHVPGMSYIPAPAL